MQAQLRLSRGGSFESDTYIASSVHLASCSSPSSLHLSTAIGKFNSPSAAMSLETLAMHAQTPLQKALSAKIDNFNCLFKAHMLLVSLSHTSSWLSVIPSEGLGLHLNPDHFQVAIKWWLGLETLGGSLYFLCPDTMLDSLGHHGSTCLCAGDVPQQTLRCCCRVM